MSAFLHPISSSVQPSGLRSPGIRTPKTPRSPVLLPSGQMASQDLVDLEHTYGAHNYHPLPVVFSRAEGVNVWDPEGRKYYDFLSAYSAVNQGHCHPKIVKALTDQAQQLCLSSRAFYNDKFGRFAKFITEMFGYDMVLPMNTGAEGVETALKLARKWGYLKKRIPENKAIIISCTNNFHGRTLAIVAMSTDAQTRRDFGPFNPGLGSMCPVTGKSVAHGSIDDLRAAFAAHHDRIAAFLVEPIQGEAGIFVPPDGYLADAYALCRKYNILFIADEIQTGLCRTGRMLACDHENIKPDVLILGKALSGGVYPVSAVLAQKDVMLCIQPGEHGSTYGGNPLACAVAIASLEVLVEEKLAERAERLGQRFRSAMIQLRSPLISAVRGKGLLNAIVIDESASDKTAWDVCLLLKQRGLLAKPTHVNIIRLAPPLCISDEQMEECIKIIGSVLNDIRSLPKVDIIEEEMQLDLNVTGATGGL